MIQPGQYILVRVYNDEDGDALDAEVLFDAFVQSLKEDWRIELIEEDGNE